MKKFIVILGVSFAAIVACAIIAQAQDSRSFRDTLNSYPYTSEPMPWPTRSYYDPEPRGIQWNVERPAPQNDWYDIRTGHYTTPPAGVIQSGQLPTYNMPRP
jgi:hypothetical protein